LSIIVLWVSGNLFHIGWNGNYELWIKNPIATIPIAHGIWDPHFGFSISDAYSSGGSDFAVVQSFSGIYNWLYASGFVQVSDLYNFVILSECLAVISLLLGKVHLIYLEDMLHWATRSSVTRFELPIRLFLAFFDASGARLNYHIGVMIGFFSIAWCGHLVHVAIPVSRGMKYVAVSSEGLYPFYTGNWVLYSLGIDNDHLFGSTVGDSPSQAAILTFLGGFKSDTSSLYLTDIAHHHLAVGVLFVWAGHVYSSLWKGLGHRIRDVLFVNGNSGLMISSIGKSLHLQLSLALGGVSVITSVVAQHTYSLTPYPYLSYDSVTFVALYVQEFFQLHLSPLGP
jgi:photosystem I P700 chlorophyll a apoprotein A2